MIRIDSGYFVAAVDLENRRAAPIIKYMKDWPISRIQSYCRKKGWKFESY